MIALCSLLIAGLEGLGCLGMTLPLALPLGAPGSWLVYYARSSKAATRGGVAMLLLLPPASLTWDARAQPPVFEVRSAITIAAPPEQVWKHVVTFSELPEPREWFFRAGLAYPKRAHIVGSGVGAIRYCEVPAPVNEWSPYARVLPRHLHGYLISKQGQFRLTRLPNNQTLLEGATWYQHGLCPRSIGGGGRTQLFIESICAY